MINERVILFCVVFFVAFSSSSSSFGVRNWHCNRNRTVNSERAFDTLCAVNLGSVSLFPPYSSVVFVVSFVDFTRLHSRFGVCLCLHARVCVCANVGGDEYRLHRGYFDVAYCSCFYFYFFKVFPRVFVIFCSPIPSIVY